jgi:hypothetical protein
LKSISYNGIENSLKESLFGVKYLSNKDILKDFNQTFKVNDQEVARIDYKKNKDESKIINLAKEEGGNKYTLPGINYIEVLTNKNNIKINIE